MQNFVFHNPVKILFGKGTIPAIGPETAAFGKRILLVYGRRAIKENGIYDRVVESLQAADLEIFEHGGVRANPRLGHVEAGIALARRHGVEAIVAAGGGSVIDSAKAIAAGALADHNVWLFFTGKKSIKRVLPLTCVLTLAASGSEMNSAMVLTHEAKELKFGFANRLLYPRVSILDPEATYTVPPAHTVYGAVDAISHVLEFYCTTLDPDTPVQDRFMEGLLANAMASCERLLADPRDYGARANMMWSATLALNGLTAAGLGKVGFPMHLIEHSLSSLHDVVHGAGLSVVMPAWMRYHLEEKKARFAQLGRRLFGIEAQDDRAAALAAVEKLQAWLTSVHSPVTLQELDIPASDIPRLAANTQPQAKIWRLPEYTAARVEEILRLCQ